MGLISNTEKTSSSIGFKKAPKWKQTYLAEWELSKYYEVLDSDQNFPTLPKCLVFDDVDEYFVYREGGLCSKMKGKHWEQPIKNCLLLVFWEWHHVFDDDDAISHITSLKLKGIFHSKNKFCHCLFILLPFQTYI